MAENTPRVWENFSAGAEPVFNPAAARMKRLAASPVNRLASLMAEDPDAYYALAVLLDLAERAKFAEPLAAELSRSEAIRTAPFVQEIALLKAEIESLRLAAVQSKAELGRGGWYRGKELEDQLAVVFKENAEIKSSNSGLALEVLNCMQIINDQRQTIATLEAAAVGHREPQPESAPPSELADMVAAALARPDVLPKGSRLEID